MFSLRRSVTQFCPWQCLFYFSLLVWFSPFVLCISSVVSKSLSNPLSIMYFWVVSLEVLCFLASVHFVLPEARTVCAFFLSSFLYLRFLRLSHSFPPFLSFYLSELNGVLCSSFLPVHLSFFSTSRLFRCSISSRMKLSTRDKDCLLCIFKVYLTDRDQFPIFCRLFKRERENARRARAEFQPRLRRASSSWLWWWVAHSGRVHPTGKSAIKLFPR